MSSLDNKKEEFVSEFSGSLHLLKAAEEEGTLTARMGIEKLYFVGCGAPYQMMKSVTYWADRYAAAATVKVFHAGEFVHLNPASLDQKTSVFLGSHSGTTREVVEAAHFLQKKPSATVAFTQQPDSPLGSKVGRVFAYGSSRQGYFSSLMITLAFLSVF